MTEYKSNPIIRTFAGAEHFLKQHREIDEVGGKHPTCYKGHADCSTHEGGPCLHETLVTFSDESTWVKEQAARSSTITREQARDYISFCVDDTLGLRSIDDMPANARLIGWQCGFEPLFVAVWSYLGDTQGNLDRVDDENAISIAIDLLQERKWFTDGKPRDPDYVI